MPGWAHLEHITPRRPARALRKADGMPTAPRGRRTWGITYRDPDLPPQRAPVTRSTGKMRQAEALVVAKQANTRLRELHSDIQNGRLQPKYLSDAHIANPPRVKGGRLITEAVADAADAVVADDTARYTSDYGEHFARYAQSVGVIYVQQVTEEMLLGFCRSAIMAPDARKGGARWYTTINMWMNTIRKTLRREFKAAPQLNSDVLARGLPTFKSQADLLKVFDPPTESQRAWIVARQRGQTWRGNDPDEGGQVLSQTSIYQALHVALRRDSRVLRELKRTKRTRELSAKDLARGQLVSVDITVLLLAGFRRKEYTMLTCDGLLLDRPEPMDRRARTTLVRVLGKGRRWRDVQLTRYTRLGIELAREQARGRATHEYVSEFTYQGLRRMLAVELPKLGAPVVAPKDCRSTGCNYAQRLLHIQEGTRAARWGHSVEVHRSYYLVLTGAALKPCATLEESMGCEPLMRRALRLLQIRNALGIAPRTRTRNANQRARKRVKPLPSSGLFGSASSGRPAAPLHRRQAAG